jgi:hypothetical protein
MLNGKFFILDSDEDSDTELYGDNKKKKQGPYKPRDYKRL